MVVLIARPEKPKSETVVAKPGTPIPQPPPNVQPPPNRPPPPKDPVAPADLSDLTRIRQLTYSPDSRLLATIQLASKPGGSSSYALQVWDLATGKPLFKRHTTGEQIIRAGFSSDSRRLAAVTDYGRKCIIWDLKNGNILQTCQMPDKHVLSERLMAFSPDGQFVLGSTDEHIFRMGVADGKVTMLGGQIDSYVRLACSPTTPIIALAGRATLLFTIKQEDGASLDDRPLQAGTGGMAFSNDGKHFALSCFQSPVELWHPGTWKSVGTLPKDKDPDLICYTFLEFSADGKLLIGLPAHKSRQGLFTAVDLWDVPAKTARQLNVDKADGFYKVALAPDGKTVAVAPAQGTIFFIDVATGKKRATALP